MRRSYTSSSSCRVEGATCCTQSESKFDAGFNSYWSVDTRHLSFSNQSTDRMPKPVNLVPFVIRRSPVAMTSFGSVGEP